MSSTNLLTRRVDVPKGYPENPMTSAELKGKFRGLSTGALAAGRIEELEKMSDALEDVGDVRELTALLVE